MSICKLHVIPVLVLETDYNNTNKTSKQLHLPNNQNSNYGKYSKISNTFLFPFSNEMVVIKANKKDPDQTASETV